MLDTALIATAIGLIVTAYLFGSLSSAIFVCRAFNLADPRSEGSKNPGATNVMRIGGKLPAALTLLGDLLKCTIPMWAAQYLGAPAEIVLLTGFAAFLGHLYPVWFGFEGGKGVASYFGILLGISPIACALCALFWLGGYKLTKTSALGAVALFIAAPVIVYMTEQSVTQSLIICVLSIWSAYRHKENFSRLIKGEELRFNGKS
ncbi:MAG: glycerol-3-phosphate 1-O-acyltransferase PlsY [Gammaproteobacteria bacterium]|nr:glycerol-3-phosphate 1-O-acyltransferase PlsY [Gammaproteobacteria bacterium]